MSWPGRTDRLCIRCGWTPIAFTTHETNASTSFCRKLRSAPLTAWQNQANAADLSTRLCSTLWRTVARQHCALGWRAPPSETAFWTGRLPSIGLRWIKQHGSNSQRPNKSESQLSETGRNLPHGARSDVRPGNSKNSPGLDYPERHLQPAKRNYDCGADHFNGAFSP